MSIPSASTVKKLRRLQAYIRKEPRRFNMGVWGLVVNDMPALVESGNYTQIDQDGDFISTYDLLRLKPPCDTVACLAGSVVLMAKLIEPKFKRRKISFFTFPERTRRIAAKWLGIAEGDDAKLFFLTGWPIEFREKFFTPESTPQKQVEMACARLDHYIETGK